MTVQVTLRLLVLCETRVSGHARLDRVSWRPVCAVMADRIVHPVRV